MADVRQKSDTKAIQKALDPAELTETKKLKEVEKKLRESETLDREAWARYRLEHKLDEKVLNRLEIRYGQWIPQERLGAARKEMAEFQEKSDFEADLAEKEPGKTKEEIERTVGYVEKDDVHVKRNIEAPGTLVHERLHTLSHPEAKEALGEHLYEGMTEELASRETDFQMKLHSYERRSDGSYEVKPPPEYYPEQRLTVRHMTSWIPESATMEAYFQGDDRRIREFVDYAHGEGSWETAKELLEKAQKNNDKEALAEARELLKGGS